MPRLHPLTIVAQELVKRMSTGLMVQYTTGILKIKLFRTMANIFKWMD